MFAFLGNAEFYKPIPVVKIPIFKISYLTEICKVTVDTES